MFHHQICNETHTQIAAVPPSLPSLASRLASRLAVACTLSGFSELTGLLQLSVTRSTMGAAAGASIAGRCAPAPMPCQSQLQDRFTCRRQNFLASRQRLQGILHAPPRSSKRRISMARIGSVGFGWRLLSSADGRLGLGAVLRAQEEETEKLTLEKVEDNPSESWSSSVQKASVVSRIFMAAFVWISLFFGISVANNEIGGGRPGRRGPRK